jgi:hypothetical protein
MESNRKFRNPHFINNCFSIMMHNHSIAWWLSTNGAGRTRYCMKENEHQSTLNHTQKLLQNRKISFIFFSVQIFLV